MPEYVQKLSSQEGTWPEAISGDEAVVAANNMELGVLVPSLCSEALRVVRVWRKRQEPGFLDLTRVGGGSNQTEIITNPTPNNIQTASE